MMTPEERAHVLVERCRRDPEIQQVLAAAMLVERERCAKLASDIVRTQPGIGWDAIAAAIREQP